MRKLPRLILSPFLSNCKSRPLNLLRNRKKASPPQEHPIVHMGMIQGSAYPGLFITKFPTHSHHLNRQTPTSTFIPKLDYSSTAHVKHLARKVEFCSSLRLYLLILQKLLGAGNWEISTPQYQETGRSQYLLAGKGANMGTYKAYVCINCVQVKLSGR